MIAPPPSVWDDAENDRTDEPSGPLIVLVASSLILAGAGALYAIVWAFSHVVRAVLG